MLSDKIKTTLKQAELLNQEKLLYTEDWHLESLPGIGPGTVKKIRAEFGQSIYSMSPKKQANTLGVSYEEILVNREGKDWILENGLRSKSPEIAAKKNYLSKGFSCENGENYTIRLLMKALMYPLLVQRNIPLSFPPDAVTIKKIGFLRITRSTSSVSGSEVNDLIKNEPATVVDVIASSSEEDLRKGLLAIPRHDQYEGTPLSDDHLVEIWKLLGKQTIRKLAECYVGNVGYIGWPDLTLIKDQQVFFVEIKTTDRLHESQVDWWREVAKPIGLNFQITKIKNANKRLHSIAGSRRR